LPVVFEAAPGDIADVAEVVDFAEIAGEAEGSLIETLND
jgi:hypothetical protein